MALLLAMSMAAGTPGWASSAAGAPDSTPDEISIFGMLVSSKSEWPSVTATGVSYRRYFSPDFAVSLEYLNDGHFPGHQRDGIATEGWLPVNFFHDHLTLSAGVGLFGYFDTVPRGDAEGYADKHAWAALLSLDAIYAFRADRAGLFVELRLDHTAPFDRSASIQTTSIGLGLGYRVVPDAHLADGHPEAAGFDPHEVALYYWKTVVNSLVIERAAAEEIEYRTQLWDELRASVALLKEGQTQLVHRDGVLFQGWLEPSFAAGLWSVGAGLGAYLAVDKDRVPPGGHVSGVISATASVRPLRNFDIRCIWHRIVTNYNRDADAFLWGLGYRF
jgi:hypothetical protein